MQLLSKNYCNKYLIGNYIFYCSALFMKIKDTLFVAKFIQNMKKLFILY